jgi:hypothetical protein
MRTIQGRQVVEVDRLLLLTPQLRDLTPMRSSSRRFRSISNSHADTTVRTIPAAPATTVAQLLLLTSAILPRQPTTRRRAGGSNTLRDSWNAETYADRVNDGA